MLGKQTNHQMTSFILPKNLHTQMKMMCVLTHSNMGEFIRISIRDKIKELENREVK